MEEGSERRSKCRVSPCDLIPEFMSFVSLDLYIHWEQNRSQRHSRLFLFGSFYCLFVFISLYILYTQTVYFDRFHFKRFVLESSLLGLFLRVDFLCCHSFFWGGGVVFVF